MSDMGRKKGISVLKDDWLIVVLILASFAAGIVLFPFLPDYVPSHWNIQGQIDRYSSKQWGAFGIPTMTMIIYLLMVVTPNLDPKRENYQRFKNTYKLLKFAITAFLVFLHVIILVSSLGYQVPIGNLVSVLIGFLTIIIGNVLGKIKHNYFVGIKTPWTLASEEVWKSTHRLASRIWVLAGLVIVVAGITLTAMSIFVVLIASLAAAVIVPTIYAYLKYREFKG